MGVLNITPDSFSDGGRYFRSGRVDLDRALEEATDMIEAGASVIDVGGESTRPGATPVDTEEETARVIPVVQALADSAIIVSIDTRHGNVARAAIDAGARMVNDVSAGGDETLLDAVAGSGVGYAIMHMQGQPRSMQDAPLYDDVVAEVSAYLRERWQSCVERGIEPEQLIVDPGFGFGKTVDHNLALLRALEDVRVDDGPLLAGLSRKSTLGRLTGRDVDDRLAASVTAAVLAAQRGADMVRVHDVAATVDGLKVLQAVECDGQLNG